MSCSDRIVRVTYPKNCSPEVNDSQQLLYNGPALPCIDVQTNQTFNDAIKEIDELICQTLNNLTTSTSSTTTSTTTCYTKECFFSPGGGAFEVIQEGCEFGPIEFEIICQTTTTTSSSTSTSTSSTSTTSTSTSTSTSTTTSTTTQQGVIPCGTVTSYSGGESYPTIETVTLGSNTGSVDLAYDSITLPDRFIVRWNGGIVIDTGYTGLLDFDFGGSLRSTFTTTLTGRIDPITLNTYPDFTTYPDDGYPRVLSYGPNITSFNKTLATPITATVEVYAPMFQTSWNFTLGCPGEDVTTTTTSTSSSTTTTTTTQGPVTGVYTIFTYFDTF